MDLKLLYKYLNDSCSLEELQEVNVWIDNGFPAIKDCLREDWENYDEGFVSSIPDSELNDLLRRIHLKIRSTKHRKATKSTSLFLNIYKSVAAILIIPIFGLLAYLLIENSEDVVSKMSSAESLVNVFVPEGVVSSLVLPDSTLVYLNSASKLSYPARFNGDVRNVQLNGEAYFEVKHNPEKPFVVSCSKLNVTALGTKFNVKAFASDNEVSTVLVDGCVVLDKLLDAKDAVRIARMEPNQQIDFLKDTEETRTKEVNVQNVIGWKDGLLIFDNVTLNEFAKILGRKYNIDFIVSEEVKDLTITAKFKNESLKSILKSARRATSVNYKIESSNDTNSKRRVILTQ
ncbi:MAG: FecR family protein [Bacteroidales bacterium]